VIALLNLLVAFATFGHAAPQPAWAQLARAMVESTGAERHAKAAELKRAPNLVATLRQALQAPSQKTEFFLGLEVISTLQLRELWPEVLRALDSDSSGYVIHTLNVLARPSQVEELLPRYRVRALERGTAPSVRMAALDSLARMGKFLNEKDIAAILEDPVPEIRMSALLHARSALFKTGDRELLEPVRKALASEPYQLRIQAIHLIQELAPRTRARMNFDVANQCKNERRAEVQDICREILR